MATCASADTAPGTTPGSSLTWECLSFEASGICSGYEIKHGCLLGVHKSQAPLSEEPSVG